MHLGMLTTARKFCLWQNEEQMSNQNKELDIGAQDSQQLDEPNNFFKKSTFSGTRVEMHK